MVPSAVIRKYSVRLFAFIIAALVASPVMAQTAGPATRPCADDAAKFCKDVKPGGGRMARCLKEHENELSPACKEHVAAVKQRAKEVRAACEDDVMQFCKDVQPGQGRIAQCLKQHENELSVDCKAQMGARRGRR